MYNVHNFKEAFKRKYAQKFLRSSQSSLISIYRELIKPTYSSYEKKNTTST